MALLLAFGSSAPLSAQLHRHTPRTEAAVNAQNDNNNSKKQARTAAAQERLKAAQERLSAAQRRLDEAKAECAAETKAAENNGDEMVAYSDTSSVTEPDSAVDEGFSVDDGNQVDDGNRFNPSRFSDPFSWFAYVCSSSFLGFLFTILSLLLLLLFLLMPFIIIYAIVRYLMKRHNDRVRLAEMAMEQGRPFTEEQIDLGHKSQQYVWRKGVKNLSIGVGLMMLFYFMRSTPLVGIGGLIACMGLGKMFMARYNFDFRSRRSRNDAFGMGADGFGEPGDSDFMGTTWENKPNGGNTQKTADDSKKTADDDKKTADGDDNEVK